MTKTKTNKAANLRNRWMKWPEKVVSKSEEHFGHNAGLTGFEIVRSHRPTSASSRRLPTANPSTTVFPCDRRELPPHNFITFAEFPDDCDSKLDECFGHTTEVIRRRILTRQLIAGLKLTEKTPAPRAIKPVPVDSRPETVVIHEQKRHRETPWADRWYHYRAGGARTAGS